MAKVTYIQPDGSPRECLNFEGMTVMHLAIANLVDGIDALCGGVMQCGTCHLWIAEEWMEKVGPPSEGELAMLEALEGVEVKPTSRLSCQIQLSEELDGLVVEIPPDQPGV